MIVGVSGASGRLGRRVAELLLDRCRAEGRPAHDVVLLTRRPDRVADLAALGATVRAADFDDPASLGPALRGVTRLLLVSTPDLDRRVTQHGNALDAAVAAGVEHVVYTSLLDPVPGNPARLVTDGHRFTEDLLVRRATRWTILRHGTYADALLPLWARAAGRGRLVTAAGEGRTAWVARDDCAAVAAAVLLDGDERHEDRTYEVTGPKRLGARELAAALTRWAGRPVEVDHVDDEQLVAALVADGLPEDRARLLALWDRAICDGYFSACTATVHDLTGHPPRSVPDLLASSPPPRPG